MIILVQKVLSHLRRPDLCSVSIVSKGHLLKVGDPRRQDALALRSSRVVASILRAGIEPALRLDLRVVVMKTVDDWSLGMLVRVGHGGLRGLDEVSLWLEGVLQLVDDGSGRAEVAEVGLDLGLVVVASFRLQVVLQRRHDVAPGGRLPLEHGFGLGFGSEGRRGQPQVGRTSESRPRLSVLAEELHFGRSLTFSSDQKAGGSGQVSRATAAAS